MSDESANDEEFQIHQGADFKSDACTLNAVALTWGDLRRLRNSRLKRTESDLTGQHPETVVLPWISPVLLRWPSTAHAAVLLVTMVHRPQTLLHGPPVCRVNLSGR